MNRELVEGDDYSEKKVTECDLCHNTTECAEFFCADFGEEMDKVLGLKGRYGNFFCVHSCWHIMERMQKFCDR